MARKPRFNLPGLPQHVIQRGNDRQACFYSPGDYRQYLEILALESRKCLCDVHAFVLMTNHVHLLVTPCVEHGLPRMMQRLGSRYVQHVNHAHRRTGTLWEGRYKAALVDTDRYVLTCYRYIEMNPVRAGMVSSPAEYPYSSYPANALGCAQTFLRTHPAYDELGGTAELRHRAYRSMFNDALTENQVDEIRNSVNRELVYGNDRFKDQIEAKILRATRSAKSGRPRLTEDKKLY